MKKILSLLLISLIIIGLFTVFNFNVKSQIVGSGNIDSGLVGYWRFDENLGTSISDSSGNSNTGLAIGTSWVTGKYGSGLNFTGNTNSYATIGNSASLTFTSSLSISAWINCTAIGSITQPIVMKRYGSSLYPFEFDYFVTTHKIIFGFYNGTWNQVGTATSSCSANVLHFVGIAFNGTGVLFDIDGVFSSVALVGVLPTNTANVTIGWKDDSTSFFNGMIDDVRIYNRVLSISEFSTLNNGFPISVTYDSGSTITPNGTVLVGVDQNQTFNIGVKSGYVNWVNYFDNVPLSPSSLYLLTGVETSHNFFITSQFIGNNPTNTPILITGLPINSFTNSIGNFPYLAQLLLVSGIIIMLMLSMLYLKKRGKL